MRRVLLQPKMCLADFARRLQLRQFSSEWSFPPPLKPPTTEELHRNGLPFLCRASEHASNGRMLLSSAWSESGHGAVVSYREALQRSSQVARFLSQVGKTNSSPFVATLCVPGADYVSSLWGAWAAGFAAVPLALSQKTPEIEHVLSDIDPSCILIGECIGNVQDLLAAAEHVGMTDRITFLQDMRPVESSAASCLCLGQNGTVLEMDSPALVIYTSGTTGKPKGVLLTHRNLFHQVTDLVVSWHWQPSDVACHVLPLHHVHGITKLCSAAYVGARLDFQSFDASSLWKQWSSATHDGAHLKPNVFMAVPTVYAKLLEAAESLPLQMIEAAVEITLRPMRLMVSGSAALPVSFSERWYQITGHRLLERYGMTEVGLVISNPYEPVEARHPGHVGKPLPSVQVRLVDEDTSQVIEGAGKSGSLRIRGPTVFREYLNRPDAMQKSFDEDGYFITGDVAEYNHELESYRILGRTSVDILKVGGYKLSALEIERDLLEHPDIVELAIVGVPDEVWGERVGMICRLKGGSKELTVDRLRTWCENKMSRYKVPTRLLIVEEIPKNAMGKVNKKVLVTLFRKDIPGI